MGETYGSCGIAFGRITAGGVGCYCGVYVIDY